VWEIKTDQLIAEISGLFKRHAEIVWFPRRRGWEIKVVCMRTLHGVSPRLEARFAGVLYLLSMLLGVMATIFISRKMQAQGDSANLAAAVLNTGVIVLF